MRRVRDLFINAAKKAGLEVRSVNGPPVKKKNHFPLKLEIRRNADGSLDEIVAGDPKVLFVHLEQMDDDAWWLGITERGVTTHVNFMRKGKYIIANAETD